MGLTHRERVENVREAAAAKGVGLGRTTEFLESIERLDVLSPAQLKRLDEIEDNLRKLK